MNQESKSNLDFNSDELERYSRHILLPEIGENGQKKLKDSSVLCVGCGGLASPLLIYLAAAGIGKIGIVDSDFVEKSNLQRQIIHSTSSIGQAKTSSAKSRIREINPNCNVETFNTCLTSENALEIIKQFDLICDCTDNFEARYLINDAGSILNKPIIFGAISKFEGQVTVFNLNKNSPNFRDLIPEAPPESLLPSCSQIGVMGILPGLIGLIQATETIKIITSIGEPLDGRLLVIDSLGMKFKELRLARDKERKNPKKLINNIDFCEGIDSDENEIISISVEELMYLLEKNPTKILLIDVRTKEEYEMQSINGSTLIPLDQISNKEEINKLKQISLDKRLYIHCKSGKRSKKAILLLKKHGIDAINIIGGIDAWKTKNCESQ